ncbi:Peptidase M14, carboxypeptidase A [Phytophthora cactorum]|nr:Peptidase M14, carboxypeptidase A [Phytophthora cactorum]
MSSVNPRANRFRKVASQSILVPPPLPLINLPEEPSGPNGGSKSRTLLDVEAEAYEEHDVLSRLHVTNTISRKFSRLQRTGRYARLRFIVRRWNTTCLIHPDVKNGAYRQWFYFEIRNGKPGITYRFALVNLAKSGALFGQGLQPVVYSEQDAAQGLGWRHRGSHVRYDVAVSPMAPPGANALTFQYEFEHENDCVYFACIQPYTYTGKDGLHPTNDAFLRGVHPGEPNSSWMMQGMLDYLTGSSSGATVLRRNFVFKVAPMLNPDGVINGNTRHSTGTSSRTAATAKKKTDGSKSSGDTTSSAFKSDPRVFPMIVARHARHFSFADCDFSVHKSKMTTARVVVNQELGVTNSYTLRPVSADRLRERGKAPSSPRVGLERKKQAKLNQSIPGEPSPTGRQSAQTQANEALLRLDAEDEESRLASDLLLDCEAAISALFAASGVDVNDRDDDNEMDSDLSGAEEEPIPPSPEQQITPQVESEPKKPQDEVEATEDSVGSASAPEEVSTTMKSSDDPTSKKPESTSSHEE